MNKKFFYLLSVICALTLFTACSSDDDDKKKYKEDYSKLEGNYSGEKLDLKYGSGVLLGKNASFIVDETKGDGVITLRNVVPGELTTELNITFEDNANDRMYFGVDEVKSASGATLKYSGTLQEEKMTLHLTVTLPENNLLGTWALAEENAVHFKFDADMPAGSLVTPEYIEIFIGSILSQLLPDYLQEVSFLEDGNISARYFEKEVDGFATSVPNLAHYFVKDNQLNVLLQLEMIINEVQRKSRSEQPGNGLLELIARGIPVNHTLKGNELTVFITKDLIDQIRKDELIQSLIAMAIEELGEDFEETVELVSAILEVTTELEVGLNLVRANDAE